MNYETAIRKAKKIFKTNNYREIPTPKCCLTCGFMSQYSIEDERFCVLVRVEDWSVASVGDLYVCDRYEEQEQERGV